MILPYWIAILLSIAVSLVISLLATKYVLRKLKNTSLPRNSVQTKIIVIFFLLSGPFIVGILWKKYTSGILDIGTTACSRYIVFGKADYTAADGTTFDAFPYAGYFILNSTDRTIVRQAIGFHVTVDEPMAVIEPHIRMMSLFYPDYFPWDPAPLGNVQGKMIPVGDEIMWLRFTDEKEHQYLKNERANKIEKRN